jgi:hypothetical protein
MDVDDLPNPIRRYAVRGVTLRLRLPDAVPDESMFFLLSLLAGGICGYLVAAV